MSWLPETFWWWRHVSFLLFFYVLKQAPNLFSFQLDEGERRGSHVPPPRVLYLFCPTLKHPLLSCICQWGTLALSLSVPPSLTASFIAIMLSSAFSVTNAQKWDVSLPLQSVPVTSLTLGWDSDHFALFFFPLPLSRHLAPPTPHLVPRWSQCRRRRLSLSNLPVPEKTSCSADGERDNN